MKCWPVIRDLTAGKLKCQAQQTNNKTFLLLSRQATSHIKFMSQWAWLCEYYIHALTCRRIADYIFTMSTYQNSRTTCREKKKSETVGKVMGALRDAPWLRSARRTTNDPNKETATTGTKIR